MTLHVPTGWPRPATETELKPKWAGEFRTHDDWVHFATTRLTGCYDDEGIIGIPAICVDNIGRRCWVGLHFARARDEGTFPVRYFWECE